MKTPHITIFLATITVLFIIGTGAPVFGAVNYNMSWSFVYDGAPRNGVASDDGFFDIETLPNGMYLVAGRSCDTSYSYQSILFKLKSDGTVLWKKLYNTTNPLGYYNRQSAQSLTVAKNGDIIIGGQRDLEPWIMRLDSLGAVKWTTWYFDSLMDKSLLLGSGFVNCVREAANGNIITAIGDEYPDNYGGSTLSNYAACLVLDSGGKVLNGVMQWYSTTGYRLGGFYIDCIASNYFVSGNQGIVCVVDSSIGGLIKWYKNYTFSLDGVGTVTNNVSRAKKLRDGTIMVAGQAYEGNCWTRYKSYYYDAWWSPINSSSGQNTAWDTAGTQGHNDMIYDFTQLINGNLVFVGTEGGYDNGGVWAIVTDSTGKNQLWEKIFLIPYKSEDGRAPRPFSVSAAPDSGFTVVGEYNCTKANGGYNGFAAHFAPGPVTAVSRKTPELPKTTAVRVNISGSRVVFALPEQFATEKVTIEVFDGKGKRVGVISGRSLNKTIIWNCGQAGAGVYVYSLKNGKTELHGTFAMQR